MIQPVIRQEIIVEDNRHRSDVAIDPTTGLPFFVLFVDNESNSLGTFESPYPTFQQALTASSSGNIIYVLPGDGTTTGLSAGATAYQLKDSQQILGAGTAHPIATTLGAIVIPQQASKMPHFAANLDVSVFDLANHNTLSGLHITTDGMPQDPTIIQTHCIGTPYESILTTIITDLTVTNCLLEAFNGASGIFPTALDGFVNISGNTISVDGFVDLNGNMEGLGIFIDGRLNCSGVILNNTISSRLYNDNASITGGPSYPLAGVYPLAGLVFCAQDSTVSFDVLNNTFTNCDTGIGLSLGSGPVGTSFDNAIATFNIKNNTITNTRQYGFFCNVSGATEMALNFENNSIINVNEQNGIYIQPAGTTISTISIASNYITGIAKETALLFQPLTGSMGSPITTTLSIENNLFTHCSTGIDVITTTDFTTTTASIVSNSFNEFSAPANSGGGGTSGVLIRMGNTPANTHLCLTFNNNLSTTGEVFNFIRPGNSSSTFTLTPLIGNTPQPVWEPVSPSQPGIGFVETCSAP